MLLKFSGLILGSIVFALLSLADIPSMCGFQVKCSSIFTSRYFIELVGYNLFPLSLSFEPKSSCFFADLNRTNSALLALRHILFALIQLLKDFLIFINLFIDDFDRTMKVYQICVISKMMNLAKISGIMEIIYVYKK